MGRAVGLLPTHVWIPMGPKWVTSSNFGWFDSLGVTWFKVTHECCTWSCFDILQSHSRVQFGCSCVIWMLVGSCAIYRHIKEMPGARAGQGPSNLEKYICVIMLAHLLLLKSFPSSSCSVEFPPSSSPCFRWTLVISMFQKRILTSSLFSSKSRL